MQHDGYSEAEALQRIDYSLGLHVFKGGKSASTVEQYLGLVLARRSPGYLSHGPHLLKAALDIAAARIARGLPSGGYGYPPHAWLASGMTVEEFNQEFGKRLGSSQSPLIPGSSTLPYRVHGAVAKRR